MNFVTTYFLVGASVTLLLWFQIGPEFLKLGVEQVTGEEISDNELIIALIVAGCLLWPVMAVC